jgi:TonB family protein
MKTRWLVCLGTMLTLAHTAWAQDDVHTLEAILKGRQMELRNYSADKTARYKWVDGKLADGPVETHTLAVFVTQSIKLKKGKIIFKGDRSALNRDVKNKSIGLTGNAPMILEVDLEGADSTVVLPKLPPLMFFPSIDTAVASLPEEVADTLPFDTSLAVNPNPFNSVFEDGHWIRLKPKNPAYTPAAIVSSVEPTFSEEAKQKQISGIVTSLLYLSETGQVGDIWLANSIGFGLDEQAVKALRQYVFKPAQHDGHPVAAEIKVETNFRVY